MHDNDAYITLDKRCSLQQRWGEQTCRVFAERWSGLLLYVRNVKVRVIVLKPQGKGLAKNRKLGSFLDK